MKEKKPGSEIAINTILAVPETDFRSTLDEMICELNETDRIRVLCIASTLRNIIASEPRLSPLAFAWVAASQSGKRQP